MLDALPLASGGQTVRRAVSEILSTGNPPTPTIVQEVYVMTALLLFALIVAILFGLGFVVKALFWVALVAAAIWLVGFFVGGAGHTWYRW